MRVAIARYAHVTMNVRIDDDNVAHYSSHLSVIVGERMLVIGQDERSGISLLHVMVRGILTRTERSLLMYTS